MSLRQAVESARRADVYLAVHALYADLGAEIASRKPRCDASGRCCHFDAFDHRLYVTTVELATLTHDLATPAQNAPVPTHGPVTPAHISADHTRALPILNDPGACQFQVAGLCSIHTIRPFGCRIFFCDPTATDWMTDAYARFHRQLKTIHEALGIEYYYTEWRAALRELSLDEPNRSNVRTPPP